MGNRTCWERRGTVKRVGRRPFSRGTTSTSWSKVAFGRIAWARKGSWTGREGAGAFECGLPASVSFRQRSFGSIVLRQSWACGLIGREPGGNLLRILGLDGSSHRPMRASRLGAPLGHTAQGYGVCQPGLQSRRSRLLAYRNDRLLEDFLIVHAASTGHRPQPARPSCQSVLRLSRKVRRKKSNWGWKDETRGGGLA